MSTQNKIFKSLCSVSLSCSLALTPMISFATSDAPLPAPTVSDVSDGFTENVTTHLDNNSHVTDVETADLNTDSAVNDDETADLNTDNEITDDETADLDTDSEVNDNETADLDTDSEVSDDETTDLDTDSEITDDETTDLDMDSEITDDETADLDTDSEITDDETADLDTDSEITDDETADLYSDSDDTARPGMVFPCETECKLDHDHQTEICEIGYYGSFVDWATIPYVWEYLYDNSEACWVYGMWQNGLCYTTPENTFDTDVRNKIALYSDGEYLYLNVIQATVNGPNRINGTTLTFTVDGVKTEFQLADDNGDTLETITNPGIYEVWVNHAEGDISGDYVGDSKALVYVNPTTYNSEFEVRIPLTALADQNPDIDLENINEIVFTSASLTYKGVTIVGVSTFPMVLAVLCLSGVSFLVYQGVKKKKKSVLGV